jgi:hypothetical protein
MDFEHSNTGNDFLDSLSISNFALLRPFLSSAELALDDVLATADSHLDAVWFPISVVFSVITVLRTGQEVEACTVGHETAYGLLHALGSAVVLDRVIAQVPGAAIRMPAARFKAAAALSVTLMELVVRHAQANIAQVQQSVACNAVHDLRARLARWLLMTQDRTRRDRLPLTQELLALMLGVQRTTVTGAASALQAAGLIRYRRGQIEILDRQGLEAAACECYVTVKDQHQRVLRTRPGEDDDSARPGVARAR